MKNNLLTIPFKDIAKHKITYHSLFCVVISFFYPNTLFAKSDNKLSKDSIIVSAKGNNNLQPNLFSSRSMQAGLLGDNDIMDIPFNITNYNSAYLESQQAQQISDILSHDTSIQISSSKGGLLDSLYIRGFPITEGNIGEFALNGIYGVSPNFQLLADYAERVDILKGPASLLYGMSPEGGVGGVINVVTKRASAQPITRLTAQYLSDSQLGGKLDVGRLYDLGNNQYFGIRVNGSYTNGNTAVDHQDRRLGVGAIALDYSSERFRASLDLITQNQNMNATNRPFFLGENGVVPPAPSGKTNLASPWTWWKSNDDSALLHMEYDVLSNTSLFMDIGGARTRIDRVNEQTYTVLNDQGDISTYIMNFQSKTQRYSVGTGIKSEFMTGNASHQLALQWNRYFDRYNVGTNAGTPYNTNLYHPTYIDKQIPDYPEITKRSENTLSGVSLVDTIGFFNDSFMVTPGIRYQNIKSDNFTLGALSTTYDESAITPLVGLLFKPTDNISLYANYVEGLSKGSTAPVNAKNSGEMMKPFRSKQYELGVKYEQPVAITTLSLFQISKPSGSLDPNSLIYSANDEQRNRGIELSVSGKPFDSLRLTGGVTYIQAELTKTASGQNKGNAPIGVSPWVANFGAEYDIPSVSGLSINGNINYHTRQYVNKENTHSIPSWTTVDIGSAYKTKISNTPVTLRLNITNILNERYWSGVASYSTFAQGSPRTVLGSISVDF
ncbi:TPA: TonB-dependent siderophore receptor [Providencia stuartii]|nr:TonB-dependent siderophore receptor [Providencia stuartii]HEM6907495.1 TonB-dependent siderophore receptor [Providencia stuartii]HEM7154731.1 TonB-dependent siderophore receptor [Providencia stuartii]HEM7523101.1 TonB-dependent siderophore receptor [Providencia stuartii]HEM8203706.1 TonB-dependent siderophore receptor [Providencia stuartii]